MQLAYYVHSFNPVIYDFGAFQPRWYGLAYLLGFLCGYVLLIRLARRGMLRVPVERVPDLVLNVCIFGVLVGGRLGYVLLYDPRLITQMDQVSLFGLKIPMWGVLEVWRGGMSAHGGVIGTVLTLLYMAWRHKYSLANIGDAACMVTPLGLMFGRIANFINGELYGRPTSVPWGVKFPTEIISRTKNPFDQALSENAPAVERAIQEVQHRFPHLGVRDATDVVHQLQSGSYEVSGFIQRLFARMPELKPRHPSQLYEAALEGALLFVICWTIGRLWKKDGMASGAFLTLYPVMRMIGEYFRVGDDPRTIVGITLSLGTWYSLLMIVPGLIYWIYWIRKDRKAEWTPQGNK